jgi:DnaJ-class molecular chaperone
MSDFYKTLGVNRNAKEDEIKKAFRKLSLQHHPDRGGDSEKFKDINEAYQTLGDKQKKAEYDNRGKSPFSQNMNGMNGMNGMHSAGGIPPEVFNMMFGGRDPFGMGVNGGMHPNIRVFQNGRPRVRKPNDVIKVVNLTFQEAYEGNDAYHLSIERTINMNGEVKNDIESVYIEIDKGIDNDEQLCLRNRGHILDNIAGDVKVIFKVSNDTQFKREGINLIYNKNITLKEALCGFEFELKFINKKTYKISNESGNIISPGYVKEIAGMGMKRNNQIGRLFIKFNIQFPKNITEENMKKLTEIL